MIALGAKCELARRHFFDYCNLKAPDFYRPERAYLVEFCETLQDFLKSDDDLLIINAPPRHGKSRTVGCFVEWVLGRDRKFKIMTGSYNEKLSTTFSKGVRDTIMEIKVDRYRPVYSDVFPQTKVKRGDAAMNLWSLADGYNNYLATSPTGTATGFGADLIIIDDLIKSRYEANNANVKQAHWDWFTGTMLSRLEEHGKIIVVMTRWATDDLAGRIVEHAREYGWSVRHLNFKALRDDGSMLCPEILSRQSYESKRRAMGAEVADANYQQTPIDIKGRLYSKFKTYTDVPRDERSRISRLRLQDGGFRSRQREHARRRRPVLGLRRAGRGARHFRGIGHGFGASRAFDVRAGGKRRCIPRVRRKAASLAFVRCVFRAAGRERRMASDARRRSQAGAKRNRRAARLRRLLFSRSASALQALDRRGMRKVMSLA